MFNAEAVKAIQLGQAITAAQTAVSESELNLAALPTDFAIHDLEKYLPTRRRQRGEMSTIVLADFERFVADHRTDGATVFVDATKMVARAVLNLGTPAAPGHCDHTAAYAPQQTAAYKALLRVATGDGLTQKAIAEWAEDWSEHITFTRDGNEIEARHAVATIRKITIENLRKATSEEAQLSVERSTFEQVKASSGEEPLPTHLRFKCMPYLGLTERTFELRIGIFAPADPKAGPPALNLRIAAAERHIEEMGAELVAQVRSAVGSGIPVVLGTFAVR